MTGAGAGGPAGRRGRPALAGLGAAAAMALGGVIAYQPSAAAVVVPGLVALLALVAGALALAPRSDPTLRRWVVSWTLAAFGLHLGVGLVVFSSHSLAGYLSSDATTYLTGGLGLLQHWAHGAPMPGPSLLPPGKAGFSYLLGGLFVVLGPHPQAALVVNAAMAAAIVPLLSDATYRHLGRAASRPVPVVATLLPGFLIWGSQLLREAGVYFLMAVAMACAIRLVRRPSPAPLVILGAALGLLVTFRADTGLVMAGALAVAVIAGGPQLAKGLASGMAVAVLVGALVLGAGLGYSGYHLVTKTNLHQINNIRSDSSQSASSGFLPEASVSTPGHAVDYLPLGATYFLLGPAPWQIHQARQLLALPDVATWWFLLPSLWRGLRAARRRRGREVLVYVLPALALTAVLALIVANYGTSVRERMQVVIIVVPLIGLGWSERHGGPGWRHPTAPDGRAPSRLPSRAGASPGPPGSPQPPRGGASALRGTGAPRSNAGSQSGHEATSPSPIVTREEEAPDDP